MPNLKTEIRFYPLMLPIQINISDLDEEYCGFPRWSLSLHNKFTTYHRSTAHLQLEWSTRTDGKWGGRANLHRCMRLDLTSEKIEDLVQSTVSIPKNYPGEVLDHTQVHTHGGNSPTRSNRDSIICRSVSMLSGHEYSTFYIRKDSKLWTTSFWGKEIVLLVLPHVRESPWLMKQQNRKLP